MIRILVNKEEQQRYAGSQGKEGHLVLKVQFIVNLYAHFISAQLALEHKQSIAHFK